MIIFGCGIRKIHGCEELIWRNKFICLAMNYKISFKEAVSMIYNHIRCKRKDKKANKIIDEIITHHVEQST